MKIEAVELTKIEVMGNNKLIADFMGLEKCDRCDEDCGRYKMFGTFFMPDEMKYHNSWDWLMPVVEKIEGMRFIVSGDIYSATVDIHREATKINIWSDGERTWSTTQYDQEIKINHTYQSAIKFIEYHNSL